MEIHPLALFAALCIGLSKAGFSGVSLVAVAIFAELHGARRSVGLVLPMLIAADLLAWPAFRKHGSWQPVWRLLGPALIGMALGWWLMGMMDDSTARRAIGCCVLLMVVLHFFRKLRPDTVAAWVEKPGFHHSAGIVGGGATFLANAAGPVIQLYLATTRMPKMELVGVAARFFLLINLLKLPLNAQLALITRASLIENLKLLPAVVLGVFAGRWLVKKVPQPAFEWMIAVFATLAGLRLLLF
ncbi:MAG: sulfite exporter TauE/SafE family protein [Verrucomicrobiota bacterium]